MNICSHLFVNVRPEYGVTNALGKKKKRKDENSDVVTKIVITALRGLQYDTENRYSWYVLHYYLSEI